MGRLRGELFRKASYTATFCLGRRPGGLSGHGGRLTRVDSDLLAPLKRDNEVERLGSTMINTYTRLGSDHNHLNPLITLQNMDCRISS